MRKKSTPRRKNKKITKRKQILFWQRGGIAQTLLLVMVIIGAFFLVGGFFPQTFLSPSGSPFNGIPDDTATPSAKDALQVGTIPFKKCTSELNAIFLLDRSGSMGSFTPSRIPKIVALKQATKQFVNNMGDDSIVGIFSYSGRGTPPFTTEDVPISYFQAVQPTILGKIDAIDSSGGTPTFEAVEYTLGKIQSALPQYPNDKLNLIIISDGEPTTQGDPRVPANAIKALGVDIFTIGIYSAGQTTNAQLEGLLRDLASKPENYYAAPTGDEVKTLLAQISSKICGDPQAQPTGPIQ